MCIYWLTKKKYFLIACIQSVLPVFHQLRRAQNHCVKKSVIHQSLERLLLQQSLYYFKAQIQPSMHPFYFCPNYGYFPPYYPTFQTFPPQPQVSLPQQYSFMFPSQQPLATQPYPCPEEDQKKNIQVKAQIKPAFQCQEKKGGNRKKEANNLESDLIGLENRNILPNMNNVTLSYVRRVNRSGKTVRKVLKAYIGEQNCDQKLKQFYAYQNYLKNNVSDYIIREAVKAIMNHTSPSLSSFSFQDQKLFNKVFRVVVHKYLKEDYLINILSSGMDKFKRKDHMKVRRHMLKMLQG